MTEIQETALTESRTLREQYAGRTDVLDKVKALSLLPDGIHADVPMVAAYYEVPINTIKSLVKDNRHELMGNGYETLHGESLRSLKDLGAVSPQASSLAVFPRRAILNVGQLLRDSEVAKAVRTYLLDVEDVAGAEVRNEAIERAAVSRAQLSMLRTAEGMNGIDSGWLASKARVVVARGLGEEPEVAPDDVPLYVPDFLKSQGLGKKDVESVQSWFGRRVASLYEAEHGERPGKRLNELPNGQIRETYAWAQRDLPLFEEAWTRWYADRYAAPLALIEGSA